MGPTVGFDLVSQMRPECFRGKGPLRYYVYEWIFRDTTVYVGRGCDGRYDKFYTTRKYGDEERHKFVLEHKLELKCHFAIKAASLIAAKEAEAVLINHWRLRNEGGSLFNMRMENLPALSDLGDDQRASARFNVIASAPSPEKCLANGEFYDTWSALDKPKLNDDDRISFTGQPTCWRILHHGERVKGSRFDEEVLRRCLPAAVSEIVEMAKEYGFRPNEIRSRKAHLYWGINKGYLAVEKFPI